MRSCVEKYELVRAPGTAAAELVGQLAALAPVDLDLGLLDALGVERLDRVCGARDERFCVLVRLEVREHPVRERPRVAARGPADTDAKPQELLRLQVLRDRPQAVVTREAAAQPELKAPELEVALVVHDEDGVGIDLEEGRRRADRAARLVHVRLGLQEGELVALEPDLRDPPRELRAPGTTVPARELVGNHRPDVVAIALVLAARIAQPDDEQVERGAHALRPGAGGLAAGASSLPGARPEAHRRNLALFGALVAGGLCLRLGCTLGSLDR